ncbi:MAG: protein-methionine-sulfoxide reductase catalytic subunit MsrP [Chloroflexi bacterium HGW-Chloroflexi-4]|jgi:sulfoxide reductase catalytic subunit YedY|nr:MAG: protein-methionine-sulfoxide reductase catalytic subunit MsrP [Chloroflexi bacterium HGW-Chloroflexi-4]
MGKNYQSLKIDRSEITPKSLYLSRRDFMRSAALTAGAAALAACAPRATESNAGSSAPVDPVNTYTDELGNPANTFQQITNYNNYYEFTTNPQGVARLAADFQTSPWEVKVYGLVNKPKTYSVEELNQLFKPEERIYRMRCVEGWSLVIPWLGFPLSRLLEAVEPTAQATHVRFETIFAPDEMPGMKSLGYPWPYQEGLRLDEANNDLTILATGMYGGELPPQNGGGIRLVVPWKYGFKSAKALVNIELVDYQPDTLWNAIAPNEYGFYSNVNPNVDHPRWSQATERRIGETDRRLTLMFNGYEDQVAHLYEGMDLQENY